MERVSLLKLGCTLIALCAATSVFAQFDPYNDWTMHHKYANEKKPAKLKPLADAGDADAAFQLAYGYCERQYDEADRFINVQKNPNAPSHCDLALPWLAKAAQHGYSQPYGETTIGIVLANEYEDDAKFWLLRALKDGNPGAALIIQLHHLKLTPQEQAAVNGDQAAADAAYNAAAQDWQNRQGQGSRASQIINGVTAVVSSAVPPQTAQPYATPIQAAPTNDPKRTNEIQSRTVGETAKQQASSVANPLPSHASGSTNQTANLPTRIGPPVTVAPATMANGMTVCPTSGHITQGHYAACDVYEGRDISCTPGQPVSTSDGQANAPGCGLVATNSGNGVDNSIAIPTDREHSSSNNTVPAQCTAVNDRWVPSKLFAGNKDMWLDSYCSGDFSVTWFVGSGAARAGSLHSYEKTSATGNFVTAGETLRVSIYVCPIDHPVPVKANGEGQVDGHGQPFRCALGNPPGFMEPN